MNTEPLPEVGAQDPELVNSPIVDEVDEESEVLRQEVPGEPVCYFNGEAFEHGAYVSSGTGVLRCEHGLWVLAGPQDQDNP